MENQMRITIRRADLIRLEACDKGPDSGMALYERESGGADEITREWGPEQDAEFRRLHPEYWHWLISKRLLPVMAPAFGPRSQELADLLAWLPTIDWLRPKQEPDQAILQQHVNMHLRALKLHAPSTSLPETAPILIVRDWAAARAAARAAAWAAAWDAARDAAWAAARDAAWDAARDAAWDAARDAAWAAARDAAWAAQHLVSGLPDSPWRPLLDIWAMGAWPICLRKDGLFVIFVPPVATAETVEAPAASEVTP